MSDSLRTLVAIGVIHRPPGDVWPAKIGLTQRRFTPLKSLEIAESLFDVVDGARSRHRSAIGWLRRIAPH